MIAYYNEFNPESAAMLRQLIRDGHVAPGDVDERSITEVRSDDLNGYTQCHFFAGIGGWSIALRAAGWPDDRPVWTGSAPCQPFSSAGRHKGKDDERHLFPTWLGLIRERRPASIFGEQVASAIAHGWLDDVYQGLEAEGYAVGAAVLPACSVGAPHRRDRLWFVAHRNDQRQRLLQERGTQNPQALGRGESVAMADATDIGCQREQSAAGQARCVGAEPDGRIVADPADTGLSQRGESPLGGREQQPETERRSRNGHVANTEGERWGQECPHPRGSEDGGGEGQRAGFADNDNGFWASGAWLDCPDQKNRLVEPGISLLANGVQHRRAVLHALGNAIVPQVATEFIKAANDNQQSDLPLLTDTGKGASHG